MLYRVAVYHAITPATKHTAHYFLANECAHTNGILMPALVADILNSSWFGYTARTLLTFVFWSSGLMKLFNFKGGIAEMTLFGLKPPWFFNLGTLVIQLACSALIIQGTYAWIGALILIVFTIATIPIAHRFWRMEEPARTLDFCIVLEHVTVVGALMLVAMVSLHAT
jgi:transmembrane protein